MRWESIRLSHRHTHILFCLAFRVVFPLSSIWIGPVRVCSERLMEVWRAEIPEEWARNAFDANNR